MTQFETADDAGRTDLPEPCAPPGISVVIPVLNEQRYLRTVVDRVLSSTYGGPLQVVLALGPPRMAPVPWRLRSPLLMPE